MKDTELSKYIWLMKDQNKQAYKSNGVSLKRSILKLIKLLQGMSD